MGNSLGQSRVCSQVQTSSLSGAYGASNGGGAAPVQGGAKGGRQDGQDDDFPQSGLGCCLGRSEREAGCPTKARGCKCKRTSHGLLEAQLQIETWGYSKNLSLVWPSVWLPSSKAKQRQ